MHEQGRIERRQGRGSQRSRRGDGGHAATPGGRDRRLSVHANRVCGCMALTRGPRRWRRHRCNHRSVGAGKEVRGGRWDQARARGVRRSAVGWSDLAITDTQL